MMRTWRYRAKSRKCLDKTSVRILGNPFTGEALDPARAVYLDDGDQVIRKAQRDCAAKKKARYEDTTVFVWGNLAPNGTGQQKDQQIGALITESAVINGSITRVTSVRHSAGVIDFEIFV